MGRSGIWSSGVLIEEVYPRPILPLGSLHADPVCRHPGSIYTAISGAYQSDGNRTLDVSTRLRVGLAPLGGQVTGNTFQGSRRLHPQQPVYRGDKGGRSVYVAGGKPPDTSSSSPSQTRGGTSPALFSSTTRRQCSDTHVVNTVSPLLPEIPDYKFALLIRDIWCCWRLSGGVCFDGSGRHWLRPTHGAT